MEYYIELLVMALLSAGISILGYLKSYIDNKKLKAKLDNIVDVLHDEEGQYYIQCPKCNEKILLAKVTIYSDKEVA